MAITSLLLLFASQVHWVACALWIISLLSACLSVLFGCKHQTFLGELLFYAKDDSKTYSKEVKKWLKEKDSNQKPRFSVVLLFSICKAFFHYALVTYIIGLGVYLGFLWRNSLDEEAGPFDNRNIFIVFSVYTGFCVGIYLLPTYPRPYEWKSFEKYKEVFGEKESGEKDDEEKALPGSSQG
jgi:hypothetical protein